MATITPTTCTGRQRQSAKKGWYVSVVETVVNLTEAGKETKKPNELVGVAGFEPATPASRTQCSTGLSHAPTLDRGL